MTGIATLLQQPEKFEGIFALKKAADIISAHGRNEDTYIVHAAEGETVIPLEVLEANPRMKNMIYKQMREMGLEPERYIVGNKLNSINPETGQPEFFLKKVFDGLKDVVKKVAPIALAIAAPYLLPAMPLAFSAGIGSFAGNLVAGASPEEALKSALLTGATAGAGSYFKTGKFLGKGFEQGIPGINAPAAEMPQTLGVSPTGNVPVQSVTAGAAPSGAFTPPTMLDKVTQGAKDVYSTYLSPNRPGLPADASFLRKYGPLTATGVGALALLDEGDKPADMDMGPTGRELYEADPQKYGFGTKFYGDNPFYQDPAFLARLANAQAMQTQAAGINPMMVAQNPQLFGRTSPVMMNDGGEIIGPGTGTSDSIPAMLSHGEFVFTNDAVYGAGNGDREKGAKKMYALMKDLEKKGRKAKQARKMVA